MHHAGHVAGARPLRGAKAPKADTGRGSRKNRGGGGGREGCGPRRAGGLPHLAGPRPASSSRLSSSCCRSLLSPSGCGSGSLHSTWGRSTCEHSQRLRGQRREGEKGSDPPPFPFPSLRPRAPPCAAAQGRGPPRRDARGWDGHHEVGDVRWDGPAPGAPEDGGGETGAGWGEGRGSGRGAGGPGLLTGVCAGSSPSRKEKRQGEKVEKGAAPGCLRLSLPCSCHAPCVEVCPSGPCQSHSPRPSVRARSVSQEIGSRPGEAWPRR